MYREQEPMSNQLHADAEEGGAEQRLQYTIKGIEKRSVDLMRTAAKRDGMKIGAWISMRMREAAEASLKDGEPSYLVNSASRSMAETNGPDVSAIVLERIEALHQEIDRLRQNQDLLISGLISKGRD